MTLENPKGPSQMALPELYSRAPDMSGGGSSTRVSDKGSLGRRLRPGPSAAYPTAWRAHWGPDHTRGHAKDHARARSAPAFAEASRRPAGKGSAGGREGGVGAAGHRPLCPRRGGDPAAGPRRSAVGRRAPGCGGLGSASPEGAPRDSERGSQSVPGQLGGASRDSEQGTSADAGASLLKAVQGFSLLGVKFH